MFMSKLRIIVFAMVLFFCFTGIAFAQDTATMEVKSDPRDLAQITCKDVMRYSGCDRDITVGAFHAFVLGKMGTTKFDLEQLKQRTDLFLEHCLDNPKDKALTVMENLSK